MKLEKISVEKLLSSQEMHNSMPNDEFKTGMYLRKLVEKEMRAELLDKIAKHIELDHIWLDSDLKEVDMDTDWTKRSYHLKTKMSLTVEVECE